MPRKTRFRPQLGAPMVWKVGLWELCREKALSRQACTRGEPLRDAGSEGKASLRIQAAQIPFAAGGEVCYNGTPRRGGPYLFRPPRLRGDCASDGLVACSSQNPSGRPVVCGCPVGERRGGQQCCSWRIRGGQADRHERDARIGRLQRAGAVRSCGSMTGYVSAVLLRPLCYNRPLPGISAT